MDENPNMVTIETDKVQARLVLTLLEANGALRPTFLQKMREKGWI